MTLETLQNYLDTSLPFQLDAEQQFRLLVTIFALVFAAALMIQVLVHEGLTFPGTLLHAATVGVIYVIAVTIAAAAMFGLRRIASRVRVWHLWTVSITGFVIGYYFLPLDWLTTWLAGAITSGHAEPLGFARLLPVWFVVTYLFIQPYLNQGMKAEVEQLRSLNALLEQGGGMAGNAGKRFVQFTAGRTDFTLAASDIRNVVVEDHYCYLYFCQDDGFGKRDLAMPLKDVSTLLPEGFLQVHRSHIINRAHIECVRRQGRNLRVVLTGDFEVPVSRHRFEEVLPLIQQRLT